MGFKVESLVLGKHSGRHAFRERLKKLGYKLNESEVKEVFEKFKLLADKKKQVFDDDLAALVLENIEGKVPETWKLDTFMITSGSHIVPTAKITLMVKEKTFADCSSGDGPVDACYKTIEKMTNVRCRLLDYSIRSVTKGEDALGEVNVRLRTKGREISGRASSTDIIEASIKPTFLSPSSGE